jgi:hypothetical protein
LGGEPGIVQRHLPLTSGLILPFFLFRALTHGNRVDPNQPADRLRAPGLLIQSSPILM